ncbi:PREDICTED: fibril-forming collagen alpha chain-like [Chinchilla lanigera]|uniref:fibril-forming collagen alpha chain-like n=1 Tax=Chinchilla lanigera TaxID=34839 RepID=UPI000697318B|nr:PREDICTED: fibril-forming collagen alpha chain-like [Chinchilla lanigera]
MQEPPLPPPCTPPRPPRPSPSERQRERASERASSDRAREAASEERGRQGAAWLPGPRAGQARRAEARRPPGVAGPGRTDPQRLRAEGEPSSPLSLSTSFWRSYQPRKECWGTGTHCSGRGRWVGWGPPALQLEVRRGRAGGDLLILEALISTPARPGRGYPGIAGRLGSCLPTVEHGRGRRAAAGERAHPARPGLGAGVSAPDRTARAPAPPPFLPSFLRLLLSLSPRPAGTAGAGREGAVGRLLSLGRRGSGSQPPRGAAPGDPGVLASGRLAPGGGGGAAAPGPGHVRPLAPPRAAASPGSPALPEPRAPLHSALLPSLNKHRGSLAASFCLHTRARRGPCQNKSSPISLDSSPNPAPPASQWSDS